MLKSGMYFVASQQGQTTHATLEEAWTACDWQSQFCPATVYAVEDGDMVNPLYEAWPVPEEVCYVL